MFSLLAEFVSLRKSLRWIQSSNLCINLCGLLCGDIRLVVPEPTIFKTIVVILFDTSLDLHIENPDLADQGAVETLLLQWSVSDVSYHGEETSRGMENCTGFSAKQVSCQSRRNRTWHGTCWGHDSYQPVLGTILARDFFCKSLIINDLRSRGPQRNSLMLNELQIILF